MTVDTTEGPIIGIFHQYGFHLKGKTVHSNNQLRAFGCRIEDTPRPFGGEQCMYFPEGYAIGLTVDIALPYMSTSKPTEEDMVNYPHVVFTSDQTWDPSSVDADSPSPDDLHNPDSSIQAGELEGIDDYPRADQPRMWHGFESSAIRDHTSNPTRTKYNPARYRLNLSWYGIERIKCTLNHITQLARPQVGTTNLRRHFKTANSRLRVSRSDDKAATDTTFCGKHAHDDGIPGHGGVKVAQRGVNCDTGIMHAYPMRSKSLFPSTLLG